jgi:Lon protease-like protein
MGAWGSGSFENDSALDWVAELVEMSDAALLVEALTAVAHAEGYIEADEASAAVAAAEVTAALLGRAAPALPAEAAAWVSTAPIAADAALITLALAALDRVGADSELQELWDAEDGAPEWHAALAELRARLSR